MDVVTEIKSRLSIEELVGGYVKLKKAGRNYKGLCPFHNEKTPSFIVSPDKQIAYCFGCNRGGDIFKFMQEIEGVEFTEAVQMLADRLNIAYTPGQRKTAGKKGQSSMKTKLLSVHKEVAAFYMAHLREHKDGKKVKEYLNKRGIDDKLIDEYQIGLAPDSFEETYKHLLDKNVAHEVLLAAGLVVPKETGGKKIYDRFRRRLIFPIKSHDGKVIAFGGRALKKGDEPKYLNSPETPIYNKRLVLYGLDSAKQAIRDSETAVIVEGYFDVIASHRAGVNNVVASSGTALTMQQLKLLKRYAKTVLLSFDNDTAGIEAAKKAVELASEIDIIVKIITIPEGKDPDDCVAKDPKLWVKACNNAKPFLDHYMDQAFDTYNLAEEEDYFKIVSYLYPFFALTKSPIVKDRYLQTLASRLHVPPSVVYDEFNRLKLAERNPVHATSDNITYQKYSAKEYLIGLLYQYSDIVDEKLMELLGSVGFAGVEDKLYTALQSYYNTRACLKVDDIMGGLDNEAREKVNVLMLYAETKTSDLSSKMVEEELHKVITMIMAKDMHKKREHLLQQMQEAGQKKDKKLLTELLIEYNKLITT